MENKEYEEGWVLTSHETDEFYGIVTWQGKDGKLTKRTQTVERWPDYNGNYTFTHAGLGELVLIKKALNQ